MDGELGVAGNILCVLLSQLCYDFTRPTDTPSGMMSPHWWGLWVQRVAQWDPHTAAPLCK